MEPVRGGAELVSAGSGRPPRGVPGGVRPAAPARPPFGADPPAMGALAAVNAGDVLGAYLQAQATDFLRSLRVHGESAGRAESAAEAADAVRLLHHAARRIGGALHTYRSLVDTAWADRLRSELRWLSGTLALEYTYAARLDRLLAALHRLASDGGTAVAGPTARAGGPGAPASTPAGAGGGALPVGAARAGALLERQLTLARTRAHSAALQALGSSRFHAVADAVAVLASETPLTPDADDRPADQVLVPLAEEAYRRLTDAVDALPLPRAEHPYHAEALARSLTAETQGDAAWLQVRLLLRRHRYAREVLLRAARRPAAPGAPGAPGAAQVPGSPAATGRGRDEPDGGSGRRAAAGSRVLDRHRDAAEAAAAAAAAARTPRIAPATAYALGVLHADQRHEVEAARFAFGRLWSPEGSPDAWPSGGPSGADSGDR